jgi:TPR repeat protein
MKFTLRHAVATIILMLSFAAPVAAGPLKDAIAAYDRDDYATALRLFRPLADQGNAEAQFNLGSIYSRGEGVSQNLAEGIKWFRKAADQGHTEAISRLAFIYSEGVGVPQDYAEAVKWYRKGADQGNADAQH